MRATQALETVTALVRESFDDDVAAAILGDEELFEVAARTLGRNATHADIAATIREIAAEVDDGLADWLVEKAEAPGGWFLSRI